MRLEWTTRVVSSIPGAPEGWPFTVVQQSPQYYYESYDDGRFEIWLSAPSSPPAEPAYVGIRLPDGVALRWADHVLYFAED